MKRLLPFALLMLLTSATACPGDDELPPPGDGDGGGDDGGEGGDGDGGGDGGGGSDLDFGIPDEYPQLNSRYRSHALWRQDTSGYPDLPNESFSSVEQLPLFEGVATFGGLWKSDACSFYLDFQDADAGEEMEMYLASFDAGTYDVTGFEGHLEKTEYRGGTYTYVSDIEGAEAVLTIDGNNGRALWGTFEARLCFSSTPGVNCNSYYDGRFSAQIEGVESSDDCGGPAPG